jgi:uncharacterized protein
MITFYPVRRVAPAHGSTGAPGLSAVLGSLAILLAAMMHPHSAIASDAVTHAEQFRQQGDVQRAFEILENAADDGDVEAQYYLGTLYEAGLGNLQDYSAAGKWFGKAATAGDPKAQNKLARLYAVGLGVEKNAEKAFEWFTKAADSGDPSHVYDLALAYDNGIGTGQDFRLAAKLYRKAAEGGFADAAASLGLLFQQGKGVPQDFGQALSLYEQAAAAGNARAQNNLGTMYTKGEGVSQDYKVAAEWFQKAADQGFAMAMTNLGVMYANGFGVELDEEKSDELFRRGGRERAPGSGSPAEGLGFIYDPRLAPLTGTINLDAFTISAQQGDPIAQFVMGYLSTLSVSGLAPDYKAAVSWFRKSAEKGVAPAMSNLGILYLRGNGVPQDFVRGYMWLNLAASSGLPDVVEIRDRVALRMTPGQINDAQQLSAARLESGRSSSN